MSSGIGKQQQKILDALESHSKLSARELMLSINGKDNNKTKKGSINRSIRTLISRGLIEKEPGRRFNPGPPRFSLLKEALGTLPRMTESEEYMYSEIKKLNAHLLKTRRLSFAVEHFDKVKDFLTDEDREDFISLSSEVVLALLKQKYILAEVRKGRMIK